VVSAVFTNDIYKGLINPQANDKKLMRIARISSWLFGLGMILIALMVPYIGGLVNVIISVGAITGGPILAPPIWALFSKSLTGRATLIITYISLAINLIFKIILPFIIDFKLTRAEEMLVGVCVPLVLLIAFEAWAYFNKFISPEYLIYKDTKAARVFISHQLTDEEKAETSRQNKFGLSVITFSLAFTSFLLIA